MYDAATNDLVANGTWSGTLKAKSQTNFKLPIVFSYAAINASDTTCQSNLSALRVRLPTR